ncbi:MAG TPA: hypothetical protein VFD37_06860 [Solirubrobacterales bacterium]|nr:hypothetical protein [Solirubrobacterales bacterium]
MTDRARAQAEFEQVTGERLVEVLELAEALPYSPGPDIEAPPLAEILRRKGR